MKYEEVLLIGGPCDGDRISVMEGIPTVRMPMPMNAPALIDHRPSAPVKETRSIVEYRRNEVRSHSFDGAVYVVDGIDPLAALIAGYRQPK